MRRPGSQGTTKLGTYPLGYLVARGHRLQPFGRDPCYGRWAENSYSRHYVPASTSAGRSRVLKPLPDERERVGETAPPVHPVVTAVADAVLVGDCAVAQQHVERGVAPVEQ